VEVLFNPQAWILTAVIMVSALTGFVLLSQSA
jgi:hypothetical protein